MSKPFDKTKTFDKSKTFDYKRQIPIREYIESNMPKEYMKAIIAVRNNNIKDLTNALVDLSLVRTNENENLLHIAVSMREDNDVNIFNMVTYLLDKRISPDTQNKERKTPIMLAIQNHFWKSALFMLNNSKLPKLMDENGNTAMHLFMMNLPQDDIHKLIDKHDLAKHILDEIFKLKDYSNMQESLKKINSDLITEIKVIKHNVKSTTPFDKDKFLTLELEDQRKEISNYTDTIHKKIIDIATRQMKLII